LAAVLAAEATPRLFRLGQWAADLVATLAAVSEEAFVAASREDVAAEASGEGLAAAAEVSVEAATLAAEVVTVAPTDTAHPEMPPQDLVAASEVTVVTEATAASPAVGMTVVAAHLTTDPAVASVMEVVTATVATGIAMAAAELEATWSRSDPEEKVGIAVTEATEKTGTADATGTGTLTDLATMTAGNVATKAAATKTPGSCVVTDETRSVLRWVASRSSHLFVYFLLPLLYRG